jgi:hypothetical protein
MSYLQEKTVDTNRALQMPDILDYRQNNFSTMIEKPDDCPI